MVYYISMLLLFQKILAQGEGAASNFIICFGNLLKIYLSEQLSSVKVDGAFSNHLTHRAVYTSKTHFKTFVSWIFQL